MLSAPLVSLRAHSWPSAHIWRKHNRPWCTSRSNVCLHFYCVPNLNSSQSVCEKRWQIWGMGLPLGLNRCQSGRKSHCPWIPFKSHRVDELRPSGLIFFAAVLPLFLFTSFKSGLGKCVTFFCSSIKIYLVNPWNRVFLEKDISWQNLLKIPDEAVYNEEKWKTGLPAVKI